MNPSVAWAEVRALFERAVAMDADERDALLADPALAGALVAEVRSLLAHHSDQIGGMLTAGAQSVALAPDPEALAGQRFGDWQLERRLGVGGMGEVWLAARADGSFQGHAAVKLLKRGMDSAAVLARFAQERQALARLAHLHIARLLDAGASDDGRPYFVLEYVDGLPLDEAARGLPLERRLRLFLQLADAVSHAHRRMLVHRDLKPSNVLVDADGQVKLLDFGIAKALDPRDGPDASVTAAGERPFTPHYASPEQVRGEPITTATDIYSLGVLLYEMLTGIRPTGRGADTPAAAARSVLEDEPTRPSRLSPAQARDPLWPGTRRKLEGDLDNILLKALEKAPDRRYASVDALAADLLAYLEGRPVSARRASAVYVAGKFIGRNRWGVLAASLGGLGLTTGLAATLLQGRVAATLAVLGLAAGLLLALAQARQAALSRDEAARARDQARQRLDQLKRITADLVFRYGDTVTTLPGGAQAQEGMLLATVASLEPALQVAPDDIDLLATLASALGRLAEIQGSATLAQPGRGAQARATVDRALALAEQAWVARHGDWRFASWHVRTLVVLAYLQRSEGRLEEAVAVLHKAAARAEASLARQTDDEGRAYMGVAAANSRLTLAQLYDHANRPSLGRPDDALREYALAERMLRELLARRDQLQALDRAAVPGDASTEVYVRHQIGVLLGGRALVHLKQDDLPAMRAQAQAAVLLHEQNVASEPRNVAWRDGLMTEANTLSIALIRLGEMPAALAACELAWGVAQALAGEEGPNSKWAASPPLLALQYGRALAGNGRHAEALAIYGQGLQHWQAVLQQGAGGDFMAGSDSLRRVAWHEIKMAVSQAALGLTAQAVQTAARAVDALRDLVADAEFGRDAQLARAEGLALLAGLQPERAQEHRQAAVDALRAAQALRPLAADHQRLLAALL